MSFLKKAWRGEAKLWQVFWVGVLLPQVIGVAVGMLGGFIIGGMKAAQGMPADISGIQAMVNSLPWYVTFFVYYILVTISAWRCRRNASHPAWGWAALAVLAFFLLSVFVVILGKATAGDAPKPVITQDVSDGSI